MANVWDEMNRRRFLQVTGLTGVALWTSGFMQVDGCGSGGDYEALDPTNPANFNRPLRLPGADGVLGVLDPNAGFDLAATTTPVSLMEGTTTDLWAYQASAGGRAYVNPTLYLRQGDTFTTSLVNGLNEDTILHWHGLDVDWTQDGHPSYQIAAGDRYAYTFRILNRGGTYWYHPHPHMRTAEQAYRGLAGLLIVEDADDLALRTALGLTFGQTDLPLLIQDKRLDADRALVYAPDDMEEFDGYLGDVSVVNLTVNPYLDVASRFYRFRMLNGSNARILRLAFQRGGASLPFSVVGTDGGLLERPVEVTEVFLSPAERVDVVVDLRGAAVGDEIFLNTLAFEPMDVMNMKMAPAKAAADGHHGHSMGGSRAAAASHLGQGAAFSLLKLIVTERGPSAGALPASLSTVPRIDTSGASTRPITLSSSEANSMVFTINGETFEMNSYPIVVERGAVEIWEVTNEVGRTLSSMPHPLHVHGAMFQVIDRSGSPQQTAPQVVDAAGRFATDLGWRDTVLVWPGETVRLAMDFSTPHAGEQNLMVHCHILEHEDTGMMVNYKIR